MCDRWTNQLTDGPTDGPTNGWTDTPSYRDARTHLKIILEASAPRKMGYLHCVQGAKIRTLMVQKKMHFLGQFCNFAYSLENMLNTVRTTCSNHMHEQIIALV